MNLYATTNKKKYITNSMIVIISVLLYILFALKRIKFSFASQINGVSLSNEVWLFPTLLLLKYIISIKYKSYKVMIYDKYMSLLFIGLIIVILFGGFSLQNIDQYMYAILQFIVPMCFMYSISLDDLDCFELFIKLLVFLCIIYSVLAIVASSNYGTLMQLIGNETNSKYYLQYRASLMLGSSITVSYYLNLTLPICFYMNYTAKDNKWKILSLIAIISNLVATAILLSRLSFIISIFIIISYLSLVRSNKFSLFKKLGVLILIMFAIVYALKHFDLNRLFMGFHDTSTLERIDTMNLGIYLFKQNPWFGTGLGRFFTRAYSNSELYIGGISGLVDPHNSYIMALSEIGIIGFSILALIFIRIVSKFKYINDGIFRKTAYIVIFVYFLGAIGGSQIFNETSFSTLFWIYIALFRTVSIRDYNIKIK